MAVQFVHATEGYEFTPSNKGIMDGRITAKYSSSYKNKQYRTCVPKRWIREGLVKEVKRGE